jgi:hypothetical protein
MESQLRLLETTPDTRDDWRLDESTREVGRRGIDLARAALDRAERLARPATRTPATPHSSAA